MVNWKQVEIKMCEVMKIICWAITLLFCGGLIAYIGFVPENLEGVKGLAYATFLLALFVVAVMFYGTAFIFHMGEETEKLKLEVKELKESKGEVK